MRAASPSRILIGALVTAMLGWSGVAFGNIITVNSTADVVANDGQCTLREAITAANTNTASGAAAGECAAGASGLDTIAFNISGAGVHTITPLSGLPPITEAVLIDGFTQTGASANTNPAISGLNTVIAIELAGDNALVQINSGGAGSTIQGLNIHGNGAGIVFNPGSNGNKVQGCFIGTNPAGTAAGSGASNGITIGSAGNTIGGATPSMRNLISGNSATAITFALLSGEDNNVIQGNLIGTNAAGTAAVPNGAAGVFMSNPGAASTLIGGALSGQGNVISGNNGNGIDLNGSGTTPGATIQGNFIGTDVTASFAIGNIGFGIVLGSFNGHNTIGGIGVGNVIAGNGQGGISIGSTNNTVQGNSIGATFFGSTFGGQVVAGVQVSGDNNLIGGTTGGANLIALNGGDAVTVADFVSGVAILTNSIADNNFGIRLGPHSGTQDTFPPTITSASIDTGSSTLTISGTHNGGLPNSPLRIEFFSNNTCNDPSGLLAPQGRTFLGFANVTADGSGNVSFGPLTFAIDPTQPFITATSTDTTLSNSTSYFELNCFNAGVVVTATPTPTSTPTSTPTFTATPTPTNTPAGVPTATATPTPTVPAQTATATPTSGPPAAVVPTLSPGLLMLLGLALGLAAVFLIRRSG